MSVYVVHSVIASADWGWNTLSCCIVLIWLILWLQLPQTPPLRLVVLRGWPGRCLGDPLHAASQHHSCDQSGQEMWFDFWVEM